MRNHMYLGFIYTHHATLVTLQFLARDSRTRRCRARYYAVASFWGPFPGEVLSLQEPVVDVAVAMSFRHVDLT